MRFRMQAGRGGDYSLPIRISISLEQLVRASVYRLVGERYIDARVVRRLAFGGGQRDGVRWTYCSWVDIFSCHRWQFGLIAIP